MSFDRARIAAAVAAMGPVIRVLVAEAAGSAPREAGCAMLVGAGGQEGTIGGGTLEWEATARARAMLGAAAPAAQLQRLALGPALGQCCGGAVVLLAEFWDAERLAATPAADGLVLRRIDPAAAAEPPLALRRAQARARAEGRLPAAPLLAQGWIAEAETRPARDLWIWGAGHVGRALVAVLSPLPDLALTWLDTGPERFPPEPLPGVTRRHAANPAELVALAPPDAEHLVLTFSHVLDLELCHRLLGHGFGALGLIGSATKWARFRNRLRALGHSDAQISSIACPIGDPALGKHPQAIAVGVAAALLRAPGQRRGAPGTAGEDREAAPGRWQDAAEERAG